MRKIQAMEIITFVIITITFTQTAAFISNNIFKSTSSYYTSFLKVNPWIISSSKQKSLKLTAVKIPNFGNLPFEIESLSYEEYLERKEIEKRKEELAYTFDFKKIEVGNTPLKEDEFYEQTQTIMNLFLVLLLCICDCIIVII